MKEVASTKVLQDGAKTGATKYWMASVLTDGTNYWLQNTYWSINKTGITSQKQTSEPRRVAGKNIGKANETSPLVQSIAEMESLFNSQKLKGYHEEGEDTSNRYPLPMLAYPLSEKSHKLKWPCYIQPKYNGVRAPSDGTDFWSRKGKLWGHDVTSHLSFKSEQKIILDGELMLPFKGFAKQWFSFQESVSAVKKYHDGLSDKLIYFVYDVMDTRLPFSDRIQLAEDMVRLIGNPQIVIAPTYTVHDFEEALERHRQFTEAGYEGSILRNLDGRYLTGKRTHDLLKLKDFIDAEFPIVGFKEGNGKFTGCAIFRCVTPEGLEFDVTPEGSLDKKRELFLTGNELIGKQLTVRFQNLSDTGIPIFPVGVTVRDYE